MAAREWPPAYADENVDRRLIFALWAKGADILTTDEAGLRQATDERQLEFAANAGRVLLTHNRRDFRRLHHEWASANRLHAGIATLPQVGSVERRAVRVALLLDWLASGSGPANRLANWGELQNKLRAGERPSGFSALDIQVALGLAGD